MNLPEFKALKAEVVKKAKAAVKRHGAPWPNGYGRRLSYSDIEIHWSDGGSFTFDFNVFVTLPRNGVIRLEPVYLESGGKEKPAGLEHHVLVARYKLFLKRLAKHTVLDALADV